MTPKLITCGYIPHAHGAFEYLIEQARANLARRRFDTLVGTGMSGALVIPRLAEALDCHFLLLRKPSDNSHTSQLGEGFLGARWIFVDDFVSSGATYRRVRRVVQKLAVGHRANTSFGGVYEYRAKGRFSPAAELRGDKFDLRINDD